MRADLPAPLGSRLERLAVAITLGRHHDALGQAIPLACELLVSGTETPAVLETALLRPSTVWRDGREAVLAMLEELGYPNPEASDADHECALLLRAFASWDLPAEEFIGDFLHRIPDVEHQSELDQTILRIFEELDCETDPQRRDVIVKRMRDAVLVSLEARERGD